jgi:hypothetical protein
MPYFPCFSRVLVWRKFGNRCQTENIVGNLSDNLRFATEAVNHTAARLTTGRGNTWEDNLRITQPGTAAICVMTMRMMAPDTETISQIAQRAERFHCGNCGEQAAVAMMFLHRRGVRPLDYMQLTNGDHAFVVIDRAANSDVNDPSTWGATAVICDAWSKIAYPATQINNNMRRMCGGNNPRLQSIYRDA